jgi:glycosyltransferase involved in cell wall biosynthesis
LQELKMSDAFLFFSIVIPAHNEEKYIGTTLAALKKLDYPPDRFEIIVVENGSTDQTASVIAAEAPASAKVESIAEMGVSRAKNRGIDLLSDSCDWVIFLDADTWFAPPFLKELNAYLQRNAGKNLGSGMVSLRPIPDTRIGRNWYRFYNFANRATATTRSIQCIRRDLLRDLRYDESLTFGEDTRMLSETKRRTRHFYLQTRSVFASTRRFEQAGWTHQLFSWIYMAALPYEKKKALRYPPTR